MKFLKIIGKIVKWYSIANTIVWAWIGWVRYLDRAKTIHAETGRIQIMDAIEDVLDEAVGSWKNYWSTKW